ncbi:MAG: AMP-binding enzyme, partial [Janthinobacterium lividum]
ETSFIAWTDSDAALADSVVGRPFANVALRIVPARAESATDQAAAHIPAPETAALPEAANQQAGLVYVRSPMVFLDYVNVDPGQEASAAVRDGDWLSVRDVGYLDQDGLLHLLGRQQRMLLAQGKNLFPEEIETMLSAHPAIEAACVIGVPDALRGVRIVALLKLRAAVASADLTAWCAARLQHYKIPRRFFVATAWPRTAAGKTDHRQLATLFADWSPGQPGIAVL